MYFEDFNLGDKFTTRSRIVTGTDIDMFAILTGATNPTFLDDTSAREMGHEQRIVPGLLILSLGLGLLYSLGLFDHLIALLGIEQVKFVTPVNSGDKIQCNVEIVNKKETRKKDRGIVITKWGCQSQEGKQVLEVMGLILLLQRRPEEKYSPVNL